MHRVLSRRWSRVLAAALIVLVTFAQGVVSAHACAKTLAASATSAGGEPTSMMPMADGTYAPPADCMGSPESPGRSAAPGNTCHSHCQAGHQVDSTPQLVFAAPVPAPTPLVLRLAAIGHGAPVTAPQELGSAPPPLTLFPKLLI